MYAVYIIHHHSQYNAYIITSTYHHMAMWPAELVEFNLPVQLWTRAHHEDPDSAANVCFIKVTHPGYSMEYLLLSTTIVSYLT